MLIDDWQGCLRGLAPRPQRLSGLRWRAGSWLAWLRRQMFYTYVLRSLKDNKLYIGFTENLEKRIKEHKLGYVDATKNRRPLKLIYYEACRNKQKALEREKYFKTGYGRRFLKNRIYN